MKYFFAKRARGSKIVDRAATRSRNKQAPQAGFDDGELWHHPKFPSKVLDNERDLIVWLPPGYDADRRPGYPVVYTHDGQNLFDPATAFAGVDWQIDEVAAGLIRQQAIAPIIVVGMANTPARLEEYTPQRGRKYARFVINEVKPFVDAQYNTRRGRAHTAVMGSSLGGLISFYMAWWYPRVFSMAACLSGSWMWNHAEIFDLIKDARRPRSPLKIYLDHGGEGVEGKNGPVFKRMRDTLIRKGFILGKDLEYFHGPGDHHDEASWARRVWRPLVFFFGNRSLRTQTFAHER